MFNHSASGLPYRSITEVWKTAAKDALNPVKGCEMPWWPKFNEMLGGFRPHELTLLCAPTGAGKTAFIANITAQLFVQRIPSFAAPVETGDDDYALRIASAIEQREFNDGKAVPEEYIAKAGRFISDWGKSTPLNIATYQDRVDIDDLENLILDQYHTYGARVILLDNLNFFLKVADQSTFNMEMDETVHRFVMLKKHVPIHILLIVHPRKTEGGRVESEFDIKGSSTAVQECNNILLFNRPKADEVEKGARTWKDRELVFKKIRKRGYNVNRPVWLTYADGQYQEY